MIPTNDIFKKAYDEHRVGVVLITDDLVKENPDIVQAVQAQCLLFGVDHDYVQRYFVLRACNPDFEAIPLGMMVPTYNVLISRHSDDNGVGIGYSIAFAKRDSGKPW